MLQELSKQAWAAERFCRLNTHVLLSPTLAPPTLCALAAGVITWWRGVWALLDHFLGDSLFGDCMCIFSGLLIILYLRFSGAKLTNFFPPS